MSFLEFAGVNGRLVDNSSFVHKRFYYKFHKYSYIHRVVYSWNVVPVNTIELYLTPCGYNRPFKKSLKEFLYKYFQDNFDDDNDCTWVLKCSNSRLVNL